MCMSWVTWCCYVCWLSDRYDWRSFLTVVLVCILLSCCTYSDVKRELNSSLLWVNAQLCCMLVARSQRRGSKEQPDWCRGMLLLPSHGKGSCNCLLRWKQSSSHGHQFSVHPRFRNQSSSSWARRGSCSSLGCTQGWRRRMAKRNQRALRDQPRTA